MPINPVTRREFLAVAGAAGLAASSPAWLKAQAAAYRVDVHYHPIAPGWITEEVVANTMAREVIGKAREWTPQRALEEMDRNRVEIVVCSVANPGIWFGNVEQGRRLARICNEYTARLMADHPGRFGLFAALPLPDVEGSLAELTYALDVLKADGIGLFSSYGDKWLADPLFQPIFAELNRRKAVVYVHPMAPNCCRHLVPDVPASLLEYPMDTTRTILQWILTKSTARYPDLRLIFSHDGGFIMGALGRLQILDDTQESMRAMMPESFRAEVAKFYYENSSSADAVTMASLRAYVPLSHVLLGTDSPFIGPMAPNIAQLRKVGLSQPELAGVERDNALALMPRLRKSGRTSS